MIETNMSVKQLVREVMVSASDDDSLPVVARYGGFDARVAMHIQAVEFDPRTKQVILVVEA